MSSGVGDLEVALRRISSAARRWAMSSPRDRMPMRASGAEEVAWRVGSARSLSARAEMVCWMWGAVMRVCIVRR